MMMIAVNIWYVMDQINNHGDPLSIPHTISKHKRAWKSEVGETIRPSMSGRNIVHSRSTSSLSFSVRFPCGLHNRAALRSVLPEAPWLSTYFCDGETVSSNRQVRGLIAISCHPSIIFWLGVIPAIQIIISPPTPSHLSLVSTRTISAKWRIKQSAVICPVNV